MNSPATCSSFMNMVMDFGAMSLVSLAAHHNLWKFVFVQSA